MDWSRTKSIFIAVFFILNIFLYWLYLDRYNEGQKFEGAGVVGEKSIEAILKEDNISYTALQNNIKSAKYISGKVHKFTDFTLPNQKITPNDDETNATSTLIKPLKLRNVEDDSSFSEFVQANVKGGDSYALWKVNREERVAIFFQKKNDRLIYYNMNGIVKVYWNEKDEVTMYEQTMLDNIEEMEQSKNVIPPVQVIQALYAQGLLKKDSRITQMKLGYSTLVKSTQTQVFVPTWEVRVKSSEGDIEEFFVNAVEGKVIDIQGDKQKVEEEDWGV